MARVTDNSLNAKEQPLGRTPLRCSRPASARPCASVPREQFLPKTSTPTRTTTVPCPSATAKRFLSPNRRHDDGSPSASTAEQVLELGTGSGQAAILAGSRASSDRRAYPRAWNGRRPAVSSFGCDNVRVHVAGETLGWPTTHRTTASSLRQERPRCRARCWNSSRRQRPGDPGGGSGRPRAPPGDEHGPRPDFAPAGPLPIRAARRKRRLGHRRYRISPVLRFRISLSQV
jgi:hypothetical protein